jgi:anti-sigma B factor antagonist
MDIINLCYARAVKVGLNAQHQLIAKTLYNYPESDCPIEINSGDNMIQTHKKEHDIDIVTITGRLVAADAPEARENLKAIVEAGAGKLIVDLSGVSFIDSSGLSVLISAFKLIRTKGGRMLLSGISKNVQTLLELTRLSEIFEMFATTEAARESISKAS